MTTTPGTTATRNGAYRMVWDEARGHYVRRWLTPDEWIAYQCDMQDARSASRWTKWT